jgi:NAD(P)-dependent dehydrogenase (short-subunit alcohol dehydrogenase family)
MGAGLVAGKVAVVSGVGRGLGRELALALAREGAAVVLAARHEDVLREVAAEVDDAGGTALVVPTNIVDREQCARLVRTAVGELGRVDCLVNNAFRMDTFQPFAEVDLDTWRKISEVNVFGTLQLTQRVVAPMRAQGGGSIVFVGSMIVRKVQPLQGGYAVSKAALLTAAQVLAAELGPDGIRVNTVLPGAMWGPNVQTYLGMLAEAHGTTEQEEHDRLAAQTALRIIPPDEDVANAAVFLASDLSRVITGQSLDVNGGEVFH